MANNIIVLAWVACGLRGFVRYLIIRSQLKTRITLERERNRAYADYVNQLPRGTELRDYEDQWGRGFWIRKDRPDAHTVDHGQVKLTP